MPQYLSTDPRAGLDETPDDPAAPETRYLSTDPAAGMDQLHPVSSHDRDREQAPSGVMRALDVAEDWLPTAGGMAGGLVGAATGPGAVVTAPVLAALGGAAGQAGRRIIQGLRGRDVPASPIAQAADLASEGAIQGASQLAGMGVGKAVSTAARPIMRLSMGAQQALRKRFPTVNLDEVALREGAIPGMASSARRIEGVSQRANAALRETARAADTAGTPPVRFAEVRPSLATVHQEGVLAKRPDLVQAATDYAGDVRRTMGTGLSMEGAHARKQLLQREAKAALNAGSGKQAPIAAQLADAEREGLAEVMRTRAPGMAPALRTSQELMALNEAMTNADTRTAMGRILLAMAGGGAGYAGGGDPGTALQAALLTAGLTSPTGLGIAAHGVRRAVAPASQELTRQALIRLLSQDPR